MGKRRCALERGVAAAGGTALRRRADQKDFALRMHQFFDHFLKGAAKPEWMEKGIAFIDREDEKERFGKPQAADVVKENEELKRQLQELQQQLANLIRTFGADPEAIAAA